MDELTIRLELPNCSAFKDTMTGFGAKAIADSGPHGITSWSVEDVPGTGMLIVSFTMGVGDRSLNVGATASEATLLQRPLPWPA